jgi:organic radical activating enzyme
MKKYCPLPFVNIYTELDGFDPCCDWDRLGDHSPERDFNQAFNGNKISQIRQDLIDGKEIPNCSACYRDEKVGQPSYRQVALTTWGVVTEPKLRRLDMVFDNLCNLKCRGCNSTASHLWYNEEIELYGKTAVPTKYIKNHSYIGIDTTHLEHLAISGGEPFYSRSCEKFLQTLGNEGKLTNIDLSFATNCTVVPSNSFHQSLLDCKSLVVVLSIDGYDRLNDYFRSPSRWSECVEVMKYFDNLIDLRKDKSTSILFRASVFIYNVNKLKEIEIFFKEHFPRFGISKRNLSVSPAFMSIRHMPKDLKNLIRPIVESYGNDYVDILNFLNEDAEDLFDSFVTFHESLDNLRNESLEGINDVLHTYIQEYRKIHKIQKKITLEEAMGNCGLSEIIKAG